ncbi:MAG TPA: hypothetical protein VIH99_10810 [Bdellovibrionota bacterium]
MAQENRAPLLSLVTAVWSDPAGLQKTFQSLLPMVPELRSRNISFEHIVVDSSPELHGGAYASIPAGYPWTRLHAPRSGIYPAMNIGARAAKGELVWFLNAGDSLLDPSALLEALKLRPGKRAALLCGPVQVSEAGYARELACPDFHSATFGSNRMCHQAVLYPRDLLLQFGLFDESFRLAADYQLHLRMHLQGVELIPYPRPFASFELGGASDRVLSVLREFSRAQRECNAGWADAVLRQGKLLQYASWIGLSRTARALLGKGLHLRLKKVRGKFSG